MAASSVLEPVVTLRGAVGGAVIAGAVFGRPSCATVVCSGVGALASLTSWVTGSLYCPGSGAPTVFHEVGVPVMALLVAWKFSPLMVLMSCDSLALM